MNNFVEYKISSLSVPDAHDSPPPLGRPPPSPQHPIPDPSSTSHLLRPSSTSLDIPSPYDFTTLEAFERQERQLWKDSLELQKRGDNAMSALRNSSVVILLGYIGLVVLQSLRDWHLSCLTGFGWTIATLFSFGGCCCASLVAPVVRLRLLSPVSTQLIYRHRIHILSIEAFKDQLRGRGLLKSQSAFGRRLGALGVLTVSPNAKDFSVYYMETLIWLSVDVLVALTIYMMAGVIFCNGDGGSLEMSYTY